MEGVPAPSAATAFKRGDRKPGSTCGPESAPLPPSAFKRGDREPGSTRGPMGREAAPLAADDDFFVRERLLLLASHRQTHHIRAPKPLMQRGAKVTHRLNYECGRLDLSGWAEEGSKGAEQEGRGGERGSRQVQGARHASSAYHPAKAASVWNKDAAEAVGAIKG